MTQSNCIFILASPRTGSTFLFQTMVDQFNLGYISNLTNDFFSKKAKTGFFLQSLLPTPKIVSRSEFGKTKGFLQPSEGSNLMRYWFGGGHPSQVVSKDFLLSRDKHFVDVVQYANSVFKKPLIIKNAWNCFRVKAISRILPDAQFIWLRRDIADAAASDLRARYIVQKDPEIWNSATPWNVAELRKKPYWEQVVDNQYAFNIAVRDSLLSYAPGQYIEIWYEDLIRDFNSSILKIGNFIGLDKNMKSQKFSIITRNEVGSPSRLNNIDRVRVNTYVESNLILNQFKYKEISSEIVN